MNEVVEGLLAEAQGLANQDREGEARVLLDQLLEIEPENGVALMMLAGSYFCEKLFADAEEVFQRLILLAPGVGQVSIGLFNCLWQLDRHEEALEEIKRFSSVADKKAEKATLDQYMTIVEKFAQ